MSVAYAHRGVPVKVWLAQPWTADTRSEVVDGELVVTRIGGNSHHYLATRLAQQFELQWRGVRATAPGLWLLESTSSGSVNTGRYPDVLVDGDEIVTLPAYSGHPLAVVEVWSPTNTLAEMNQKRFEYLRGRAACFVEAQVLLTGAVRLEWFLNAGDHWRNLCSVEGQDELVVELPRPFALVPDSLLS